MSSRERSGPGREAGVMVQVRWNVNPFRGDRFEEIWTPVAEAALDYGATRWALLRSQDGELEFLQLAHFPDKEGWERYWYSDEVSAARTELAGHYQIPLLPTFHTVAGSGELAAETANAARA